MGKLNQEAQTKLVRILSMGRGRLDFAKQLVVDDLTPIATKGLTIVHLTRGHLCV